MKELLNYKLIEVGEYTLKLHNVISFIAFMAMVLVLLVIIKRVIYHSKSLDTAKKFSANKLSRYVVAFISILISLHLLNFDISVLLAGSAAILVGLGFGIQNLFSDFISGVILLLDSTLKVGDIIEVNKTIYKVLEINFRTTQVIGRDESYVIMPNSELTKNQVINWTHSKVSSRFKIDIGVDYSTDVEILMRLVKEVAIENEKVLRTPEPYIRFEDYGDSALLFSLYFYTDEIFRVEKIKSDLRVAIFKVFKDNQITIPFPQRVIYIEENINKREKP